MLVKDFLNKIDKEDYDFNIYDIEEGTLYRDDLTPEIILKNWGNYSYVDVKTDFSDIKPIIFLTVTTHV
jgi:hypothetical protein